MDPASTFHFMWIIVLWHTKSMICVNLILNVVSYIYHFFGEDIKLSQKRITCQFGVPRCQIKLILPIIKPFIFILIRFRIFCLRRLLTPFNFFNQRVDSQRVFFIIVQVILLCRVLIDELLFSRESTTLIRILVCTMP